MSREAGRKRTGESSLVTVAGEDRMENSFLNRWVTAAGTAVHVYLPKEGDPSAEKQLGEDEGQAPSL